MSIVSKYINSDRAKNYVYEPVKGCFTLSKELYNDYVRFLFLDNIPYWYECDKTKNEIMSAIRLRYYSNGIVQEILRKPLSDELYRILDYYRHDWNDNMIYIILNVHTERVQFKFKITELLSLQTDIVLKYMKNSVLWDIFRYVKNPNNDYNYEKTVNYIFEEVSKHRHITEQSKSCILRVFESFHFKCGNTFQWKFYERLASNVNLKRRINDIEVT